jgi:uncharacterized glyoxalase superfamily protein PhnB
MVQFNYIIPVLYSPEVDETAKFYNQFLGFSINGVYDDEKEGSRVIFLQHGNIQLMVSDRPDVDDAPLFTGTLYFNIKGVEEYYNTVKANKEVEFVWDIGVMEYGTKEFGIRDNNGYTLAFAEVWNES